MNKSVIITGASKGIGKATAETFAQNGYNVLIVYNSSEEDAFDLKNNLNILYPNQIITIFKCDIKNIDECLEMAKFAISIFGKIDVLVANAGVAQQKLFIDCTDDDFNYIINNNLKGVYNSIRSVVNHMINNKSGHIITISSIWGICGGANETIYSASKAGIIGLSKALANELGPSNICVNCIAPGVIDTQMNNNLTKNEKQEIINTTPLNRLGEPKDIAKTVLFLAQSSFITGQTIIVDGGLTNV